MEGRDGEALSEDERSDLRRDRFGFVFQTFNLIPVLTAEENVAYPHGPRGRSTRRRGGAKRASCSTAVGLDDKFGVRPDLLSGGQRQRVAIARALANRPVGRLRRRADRQPRQPHGRGDPGPHAATSTRR